MRRKHYTSEHLQLSKHSVVGFKLYKLTIGQLEALDRLKNPYVCYEEDDPVFHPANIGDFIAIASQYVNPLYLSKEGDGYAKLSLWTKFKLNRVHLLQRIHDKIQDYLLDKEVYNPPRLKRQKKKKSSEGVPYTMSLKGLLCKMGLTQSEIEARDFSISDALWYVESHYESETGETRIMSAKDEALEKELAEWKEKTLRLRAEGKI